MSTASRTRRACSLIAALGALVAVGGCGSQASSDGAPAAHGATAATGTLALPKAHPQAIEPTAGIESGAATPSGSDVVGDVNAHAPGLAEVKRELRRLNLCGGVTNSANAAPIVRSSAPGFVADPGTSQTEGQLPELTAALDALGKALRVTIYGISGYRTPEHSVAVGGFANDPHTRGLAEGVGVGSLLRSSAAEITEADLARFGLYRPFDPSDDPGNPEVNHIQLIPSGGPLTLAQVTVTYDPDPTCQ